MIAVDAAEAKISSGDHIETALVEYAHAIDAACKKDAGIANLLQDPACAASRVVLLWTHYATCSQYDSMRRETVERAIDDAVSYASQDAHIACQLLRDSIDAMRAMRKREDQRKITCFVATERAVRDEACVLERSMHENVAERELFKRLRHRVSVQVDATDETRTLWARRGLTRVVTQLIRSPCALHFIETTLWCDGWREFWFLLNTTTSALDGLAASPGLISAALALATATARTISFMLIKTTAPCAVRRSLERAVCACLKVVLVLRSNLELGKDDVFGETICALTVAVAFACTVGDTPRLGLYAELACIARAARVHSDCDFDSYDYSAGAGDDDSPFGECAAKTSSGILSSIELIRQELVLRQSDRTFFGIESGRSRCDVGSVIAERVALSAVHESIVSARNVPERIVSILLRLIITAHAVEVRRELADCFSALHSKEYVTSSRLLQSDSTNAVCAYAVIFVARRHVACGLQADTHVQDRLARDYCLNRTLSWARNRIGLLVDIALECATACSHAVGESCLQVARDAILQNIMKSGDRKRVTEFQLVTVLSRIAKHPGSSAVRHATIEAVAKAWRDHPECANLGSAIRQALPHMSACGPNQISERLAIIECLFQPRNRDFAAAAIRFAFAHNAPLHPQHYSDTSKPIDQWWETHDTLITKLISLDDPHDDEEAASVAEVALATLEACALHSMTPSHAWLGRRRCGEIFRARHALTKLLELAMSNANSGTDLDVRHALSRACRFIVGDRGATCREAFALSTEGESLDANSNGDVDENAFSYRAVIDALDIRCNAALQQRQGSLVVAAFAAMTAIVEFDRNPKTAFGTWALESLARNWHGASCSGLAYAELRRLVSRQRIAESVADVEHCRLLSDFNGSEDPGLEHALNVASMASPETDGTVRVVTGDRSPFGELKSLIKAVVFPSIATGAGAFVLMEALGSIVFWPRRREERLAVEAPKTGGASSLSRQQQSEQQSVARPSLAYGLALAAAAAPSFLTGDPNRDGPILVALSPYPAPGADKALIRLRPATCLFEVTLRAATLKTTEESESLTSVASRLLDSTFQSLLKNHVDKIMALLVAELAGPRTQAAHSALRLLANSCIDDNMTQPPAAPGDATFSATAAVKQLFAEKFLMIAARVLHHDWEKESCASNKAARLRCMAYAIDCLEPQVAARFAPKIMATLSAALLEARYANAVDSKDIDVVGSAVDALSRYARILPLAALKSQLSGIVTALVPALEYSYRVSRPPGSGVVGQPFGPHSINLTSACQAIEKRATDLLRWLLVDRKSALGSEALTSIPRFPRIEQDEASHSCTAISLREAHDSFLAALRTAAGPAMSSTTLGIGTHAPHPTEDESPEILGSELLRLARLVEHESAHVQLAALEVLRTTMSSFHRQVSSLILDPSNRCAPPVIAVIAALLRVARKSAKVTDDTLKLACAACIGELGAIDPTRLQSTELLADGSSHHRDPMAFPLPTASGVVTPDQGHRNFDNGRIDAIHAPPPWNEDRDHLAARIICTFLVPALREGADNRGQDSAAYAIQELLKLLRGSSDSIPAWATRYFHSAGCYELVAPYAATEYVLYDPPKHKRKKHRGQPEAAKYANQSSKWLSTWTRLLVSRARSLTHSPIFRACRAIIRFDDGLATALLPYLVADALCCGDSADTLGIVSELKAIIEITSSEPRSTEISVAPTQLSRRVGNRDVDPVALQIVFSLHTTLDQWCDGANLIEKRLNGEPDADLQSTSLTSGGEKSHKRSTRSTPSSAYSRSSTSPQLRRASFPAGKRLLQFCHPFTCFDAALSDTEDESKVPQSGVVEAKGSIMGEPRKRARSPSPFARAGQARIVSQRLETAVAALPYADLACAAESIGAYARALMYYEHGIKHTSLQARLHAGVGTDFGDNADGYLPALGADHIEMLQRLAWRLDRDPDYVAGLAAARGVAGSRATLVQQVREHESEGQWRDALHCYEHILRVHATTPTASMDVGTSGGTGADILVTRTMSIEDAARGLLQCQLELGHLESAIVNADGFLSEATETCEDRTQRSSHEATQCRNNRRAMLAAIAPVAAEAAWRLQRWPRLKTLLNECDSLDGKQRSNSGGAERDPRLGLARCIAALHEYALAAAGVTNMQSAPPRPKVPLLSFENEIVSARLEAMAGLSAASMESYTRAYPFIARLGALRELEHARTLIDVNSPQSRQTYYRDNLYSCWEARLHSAATGTAVEMLALRRACLELAGLSRNAAECSELSARLARKAGSITLAQSDLHDAARLGASSDALLIAEAKLALVENSSGSALCAYTKLEPVELDVRATRAKFGLLEYHEGGGAADTSRALVASREGGPLQRRKRAAARRALAKRLVLATDCLVDAQMRQGADVVQRYKLAIDLRPKWDRAYFGCARVFDSMLANRRRELVDAAHGGVAADIGVGAVFIDGVCNFDAVAHEHAKAAIRHFALCLEHSSKYAETALPRLLTLWFEFAAIDSYAVVEFTKTSAPTGASHDEIKKHDDRIKVAIGSLKRLQAAIIETIKHVRKNVPAAVIYGAVQQILSRAGHPHLDIRDGVLQLLSKVMEMHPQQALYSVSGLLHSTNAARQEMGTKVLATAISSLKRKSGSRQQVVSLEAAKTFFRDLISLARLQVPGTFDPQNRKFTQRVELNKKMFRMTPVGNAGFVVPTRSALKPELHHTDIKQRHHGNDLDAAIPVVPKEIDEKDGSEDKHALWPTFSASAPRIAKIDDWVTVLGTKAAPKKITFVTTDGTRVDALCKCEMDGDFRKDARVQDFNDIVNRLFARDRNSRHRKLRLRTYTVVILDEQCGLCEWVTNTMPLRSLIRLSYQMRKSSRSEVAKRAPADVPDFSSHKIKQAWSLIATESTLNGKVSTYRRLVLSQFSPCLSIWFERIFSSEPAAWLEARAVYARSVATWSAVGYLIGLGDRHSENILLDTSSAECVHVDFDCLFDKGATLKVPERVPFRLTTHVVEALGITGVDGCFRRSLERALSTLRENKETLLNVLEPFLRDPTVGWTRLGKAQEPSEDGDNESMRKLPPQKRSRVRGLGDANQTEESRAAWHLGIISQRLSGIVIFPVPRAPRKRDDRMDMRREIRRKDKKDDNAADAENSPTDLLPLSVAGQVRA